MRPILNFGFLCLAALLNSNLAIAAESLVEIAPVCVEGGQIKNGEIGVEYCKTQLPNCSDLYSEDETNTQSVKAHIRTNMAQIIGGRYVGLNIDPSKTTATKPAGTPWTGNVCSVVGHNLAAFLANPTAKAEIKNQKILKMKSCGTEPKMTLSTNYLDDKDIAGEFEFDLRSPKGRSWVSYMYGVQEWATKRVVYEYLSRLVDGSSKIKVSSICANESGLAASAAGAPYASGSGGASSKDLQIALGKLVAQLNTMNPDACSGANPNNVVNCASPSMDPAATAYCSIGVITRQLNSSRFEQMLSCQVMVDSARLSDLTLRYLFKAYGDIPDVDMDKLDSDVLKAVVSKDWFREGARRFSKTAENESWDNYSLLYHINRSIQDDTGDSGNDGEAEDVEEKLDDAATVAAATMIGEKITRYGTRNAGATTNALGQSAILFATQGQTSNGYATGAGSGVTKNPKELRAQVQTKLTGFQSVIEWLIVRNICGQEYGKDATNNMCDKAKIKVEDLQWQ